MIIQHNLSALNTQNKLKLVGKNKMTAMEKLSSGYRINRAADDSAGLAISEKMRGQIRGLDRAALNTEEGISLVKVADGGLNEVHSIIQRQRELMVQAANDTNTDTDRQAIEEEVTALGAELDRLFGQTEYNTINIFKGHDTIEDINKTLQPANKTVAEIMGLGSTPNPTNPATNQKTTITDNLSHISITTSSPVKKYMTIADYYDPTKNPTSTSSSIGTGITQKDATGPIEYDRRIDTYPAASSGTLEKIWSDTILNQYTPTQGTAYNIEATNNSKTRYSSTYNESETVVNTDEYNHNTFLNESVYSEIETETIQHELKVVKSEYEAGFDIGKYTNLPDINAINPSDIVDANGRIHVQNSSGDLVFPDVVSQFTVEIDGVTFPNIWDWSPIVTTKSATEIETAFNIQMKNANGNSYTSTLTQQIVKVSDNYIVTYLLTDNDPDLLPHTYSLNPQINSPVKSLDGHGELEVTLNGNKITYKMNALEIPYQETTTIYSRTETLKNEFDDKTDTVYTPQYLDIQVGANSNQNVPIRLWDLSTAKIKGLVPNNISAFNAQDSLVHLDRILDKMSNIRAYYGAQSNRLEHAYANDTNESENLQASESKIRDADMSDEMVKFAKDNILEQAGQAMLTQANNMNQGILQLLQ